MINNIKIICTISKKTNSEILKGLKENGADFFRINLSHTDKDEIESEIIRLKEFEVPIMIDTEGSQIRTRNELSILIKRFNLTIKKSFFKPNGIADKFKVGDIIHLGFNNIILRVVNIKEDNLEIKAIKKGFVGSHKGVHLNRVIRLPFLSEKDLYAIKIAKKHNVKDFSLSFVRSLRDIEQFKELYPEANFLAKIETEDAVKIRRLLIGCTKGVLIDRGDLSREVPIEKIPMIQKDLIDFNRVCDVFVATNTLESMYDSESPSVSDVNDIANTILDGVSGFVLTKEIAVGKNPVEVLKMLKKIISEVKK